MTGGTLAISGAGTLTQNNGAMQLGIGGDYNWQIHDATGAAGTGYDTTGFTNALDGGAFSVGLADSNTDIVLTFTAVPEPNAAALLGTLGTLILLRRRR